MRPERLYYVGRCDGDPRGDHHRRSFDRAPVIGVKMQRQERAFVVRHVFDDVGARRIVGRVKAAFESERPPSIDTFKRIGDDVSNKIIEVLFVLGHAKVPDFLSHIGERLKLPDNCIDVTEQHAGERLVITGYGSWDGSATAKWEKIAPEKKPDDEPKAVEAEGDVNGRS